MVRTATAWTAAVCLISMIGCASSRGRTTPAAIAPQTAQTPPASPQLATEQLIHLGDTLRLQGQSERAAEMYGLVLEREPGNLAARQRLAMLPPAVNAPPQPPPSDRQAQAPSSAPPPAYPQQPSQPPAAPGVIEDVPVIPGPAPRNTVPPAPAPGAFDSATKQFRASSALPTTVVTGGEGTHTIQIIPASKGGPKITHQLKVSEDGPSGAPEPFRVPVNKTALPRDTADGSKLRRSSGVSKPPLPAGLRELRNYLEAPARHVSEIASRLRDDSVEVRSLAAFLLGRAGEDARPAVPALEALLASEQNGPTRVRAAEALVRIRPDHEPAAGLLVAGLSASDRAVRWEAVCVSDVLTATPYHTRALKRIVDRLQDVESRIQVMAALKLGEAGWAKAVAEDALETVLRNPQSPTELQNAAKISLAARHAASHKSAGGR
jgi:hypothetical protein